MGNLMAYINTNIHTDTKYLGEINKLEGSNFFSSMSATEKYDKIKIIQNLQSREKEYYGAIDAGNYTEFMNKVRLIINDDVARTLAKLSGAELRKGLQQLKNQYSSQVTEIEEIQDVVIDIEGLKETNVKIQGIIGQLRKIARTSERSADKSKLKLGIAINTQELKKIINLIEQNSGKSTKSQLKEGAGSTTALMNRLTDYSSFIYLSDDNWQAQNVSIKDRLRINQKFLGYPWNFDKNDVQRATELGAESEMQIRLKQALDIIKAWLMEQIQGQDEQNLLHNAIEEEWNKIVSENYTDLTNASFFFKGGYVDLVVGALGEFQAAVLNNIIMRVTNNYAFASRIQGNEFKEGTSEQAKADVLFGKLGIQVKNYVSTDFMISGNIHPWDLTRYYDKENLTNSGVFTILANKFASKSDVIDLNAITIDLENAVASILSFDSMEEHLNDSVSFYLIAGRYLVPASVIVAEFSGISGGKSRTGDQLGPITFNDPSPAFQFNEDGKVSEEVRKKYWTKQGESWIPTTDNSNLFTSLLQKHISIRANFTPSKLPTLNQYALW